MSLLSTFLQKPYTGMSQTNQNQLLFSPPLGRPIMRLEATDLTAGAEVYPQIGLWTDRNVAGAGGAIQWQAQNSTPAFIPVATLAANINVLTAGAESSQIDQTVYSVGATKKLSLRGDLSALVPAVDGALGLGVASLHWGSLYLGDGTRGGSLLPNATEGLICGSDTNHGLALKTNGVIRARFDNVGRFAHNDVITAATLHHVGGTHVGSATTLYGYDATLTLPVTTTVAASLFYALPSSAVAAFTLTDLASFHAGDVTRGAGSTVTNYYHFRAQGAGSGVNNVYGFYSNLPLNSITTWAFYGAGTAPSLFGGPVGVNVGSGAPFNGYLYADNVGGSVAAAYLVTRATLSGLVIDMRGGVYTSAETFLNLSQTGTSIFKVRGDGVVLIGNGATATTGSIVTLAGGLALPAYDTYSANQATTLQINGTHVVPALGQALDISLTSSVTSIAATGLYCGIYAAPTIAASIAGARAYAMLGSIIAAGAGTIIGMYFQATHTAGASGTLTGCQIDVSPVATSGVVAGLMVNLASTLAPTTYGVRIFGAANAAMTNGFYVDSTVSVSGWAFQYNQRAAATGGFLSFVDSGAATRFSVDVNGDMTLGSTSRRIKGDLNNATHANRLIFVNASGALSSYLGVAPSAAGLAAGFVAYGNPDPSNSGYLQVNHDGSSAATIFSTAVGTGVIRPIQMQLSGQIACLSAESNGDIRIGGISGMTTASAFGFPYIPSGAGAPTGVPTVRAGSTPMWLDTTNNKLWAYLNAAWKGVVLA